MARVNGVSRGVTVILFCECMRVGEDSETADPEIVKRAPGWYEGEFDVMTQEEIYAAVANHRAACTLQPDLIAHPEPRRP